MSKFLLSLIPWMSGWFAVLFFVYSYTGEWPNWWSVLAGALLGVAWGSRRLV